MIETVVTCELLIPITLLVQAPGINALEINTKQKREGLVYLFKGKEL